MPQKGRKGGPAGDGENKILPSDAGMVAPGIKILYDIADRLKSPLLLKQK